MDLGTLIIIGCITVNVGMVKYMNWSYNRKKTLQDIEDAVK